MRLLKSTTDPDVCDTDGKRRSTMKNFFRALKLAARFWPSIALATFCSFAVAALWGANIGAFYPVLEVTIHGKSMHEWVDDEIERNRQEVQRLEAYVADLRRQMYAEGVSAARQRQLQMTLADAESQKEQFAVKLASYQRTEPWIKRFVPSDPFQTIALIMAALIVSTLVKHIFLITNEVLVGRVALNISRTIRMQIFDKALAMDRGTFSNFGVSGFATNITQTTDMLTNGLMAAMGALLREPLKIISCLVGAGLICWRLLLLSVVAAPLVGGLLYLVTKRLKAVSRGQLEKAGHYNAVMLEALANINTVQIFRMEKRESERFGQSTKAIRDIGLKFVFYSSLSKPIIEFLGLAMLGTTVVGGAYLVLYQETSLLGIPITDEPLSVSALLVFFGMLIGISDPLRKLSAVYSSIYAGAMAADGLFPLLDIEHRITDPAEPQHVDSPHRILTIEDVDFGYQPDQLILRDVCLEIPYGSTVAIIGHNGSGKSTLIHLLGRFYDPLRGRLAFDGIDFRDMRVEDIRRRMALVNQNTELFNESVAFNIRYGRPDATDEEVFAAARQAHAHDFIVNVLPEGYNTWVGENGSRLSGGQRQRIALARALLCNPEILILDEATSQIDMQSEQLIRESLALHRGERTMLIITHREKLLELADRVYEVVEGRLIERPHLARSAA
ncbi:MAG: ABC transporter ATP-binding protein [Planctomycetota bacterium]|nr:MAG: ABC transporter ATP-binding protein [Planctomycetota bacterium]